VEREPGAAAARGARTDDHSAPSALSDAPRVRTPARCTLGAGDTRELVQKRRLRVGARGLASARHVRRHEVRDRREDEALGQAVAAHRTRGARGPRLPEGVVRSPARKGRIALSLAYKVDKDSHARIDAYFFDAAGEAVGKGYITLADAKTTKAFEVAKDEYEIPDKATGFGINVIVDKPGTVWIDSVSATMPLDAKSDVKKTKGGGALLENGRFDEDVEGWMPLALGSERARRVTTRACMRPAPDR
jgi:hypothetical protein